MGSTEHDSSSPALEVRDVPGRSRFELVEGDVVVGVADYEMIADDVAVMPRTFISADRRGEGLGDRLLEGALAELSARDVKVVPRCWFVADYLARHPDAATVA